MSRTLMSALILCGLLISGTISCTKKNQTEGGPQVVNLSIWGNYISPEMQNEFEKETGIKINISNYSSNEELLAKVQMGGSGIDVAVPSDYMVDVMRKMDLLEALSEKSLPNKNLISEKYLKQDFDPENKYSVPYSWSTAGIAVNRSLFTAPIKGWKDLLANDQLKGKFALLDDVRETLGTALKMNGYSVNSTNPAEIQKAKESLFIAKKNTKLFSSDSIDILKNKEVVAAHCYSTEALQAAAKSTDKIEYIIPEEGSTFTIDNLVIIKGSKHLEAAHKLINFLISEKAELNKVKTILAGPILKNTRSKLPKELQQNEALFPSERTMKKLERIHDLKDKNNLFDDAWTEVKTK